MNAGLARRAAALVLLALPAGAVRAVTLSDVLRDVAAASPMLAERAAMSEAAAQRVAPAGAWDAPMLEFGLLNVPTSGRLDMDPMTMTMIGVRQRLPVSGANGLRSRAARAGLDAERADQAVARADVFAMAWDAYTDAWTAGRLLARALAHQGDMDALARAARARYDAGGGRLDGVLRADAERARSLADIAVLQAESRGARARLDALRGRDTTSSDTLAAPALARVGDDPAPWLDALGPAHPRLRALRAQVEQRRLDARAMRRMAWPDLDVTASYGIRRTVMDVPQDNMWSATVGVMLPVGAGGRTGARGAEMDAMARAGESALRAALLELRQQVITQHAAAVAAQRTVTLFADTVLTAQRRATEAARASFAAGGADLVAVLEAEHASYTDELELDRARANLAHAAARLYALTLRADLAGIDVPAAARSDR